MNLTIFAAGSRGDIQPCVVLAQGLARAGYRVRLAAPADFAAFAADHDVPFYPLRGDVQAIMAGDTGREFMETGGGNPLQSIRAMRSMIAPIFTTMAADATDACRDADALICLGVFSAIGQAIAAALQLPIMHLEPTPLLPTRVFPAPSWFIQRNLGGLHNRLSGIAMLQVVWQWYRPFLQSFRQSLGLPAYSFRRLLRDLTATPMLGAYSPRLIPPPADWPACHHITGYLFLDEAAAWQPPADLQTFLAAGEPPVYIGFGSMGGRRPQALAEIAVEALVRSGRRGVLLTGWGGLRPEQVPDSIFVATAVPHSWLFPRMAAVVHHGGAGTTAEGLRAGVPTVVVPFILDQPFWGARVHAMGLGPAPIPQKQLSAARLAAAIDTAVSDAAIRRNAAAAGAAIRAEDGVAQAVAAVARTFGDPAPAKATTDYG